MAKTQDTITIKFKPEGDKRLLNAIKALDRATKGLVKGQLSLGQTGERLRVNTKKAGDSNTFLGGTFAVLRSKMLLFNFAMGLGIRQMQRFVAQGAKMESMNKAFTTLSGGGVQASKSLKLLKEATNDTMSEFDLFQQANNAMVLGVSKNSDEMAEMFDIAQRLGRALGKDTASSVESLITGIGRQSRLMLDNIGIIVKAEEAYEQYAEANNTTADALTDAQKKQAFLNATMESARKKAESLGIEVLTTQDKTDALSASMTNLASAIGQSQLGNLVAFLGQKLAQYTNNVADALKPLSRYEQVQKDIKEIEEEIIKIEAKKAINVAGFLAIQNQKLIPLLAEKKALEEIEVQNAKRIESEKKLAEALRISGVAEEHLKEISAGRFSLDKERFVFDIEQQEFRQFQKEDMDIEIKKVKESTIAQNKNFHSLKFLSAEQKFAVDSISQLGSAFADATLHGGNMGEAVVSSLKAIASQLIAQSATYALLDLFTAGSFSKGTSFFKFLTAHTGGLIKDNGTIQRFAQGGTVQGEDNVPILAQAGEFVMSRKAVQTIGVEALNQMNQGGTGSLVVNVSAPLVDETVIDTIIPAIQKAQQGNLA